MGSVPATAAARRSRNDTGEDDTPERRREKLAAKREIESEYESKDLRDVFEEETVDIRERLAEHGDLPRPDASQFSLGPSEAAKADPARFVVERDGVGLTSTYDDAADRASAYLFAAAETETGEIHLNVLPELNDAFAVMVSTETVQAAQECHYCRVLCDNAAYGYIVLGVTDEDMECSATTFNCDREPTCDECPGQDKCDDGGTW